MYELKEYRGHIRNWEALCEELNISKLLSGKEREEQIILQAHEKWGCDMGNHMHGMFALALEDNITGEIFCLRDQFGTKPFYYYITSDNRLLYGNDIRTIMSQEGFVKELNEDMLQLYMTFSYVAGEHTFFKGIDKLMPGFCMTYLNGRKELYRYWRPEFHADNSRSLNDFAEEIHETMKQMMSEVKEPSERAWTFLSGGVDSSYVAAMADVECAAGAGYEDERFDESRLAAKTAEYLNIDFSRRVVSPEEFFAEVPYVMENMEQPLGDASAIVFSLGCKSVAKSCPLCYSGEGSDEMFGGYNMYRNAERYGDNLPTFYVGNTNLMKEDEKRSLLKYYNPEVLPINLAKEMYEHNKGLDPLSKMSDIDIQIWLEGDIYLNVDKMSTACGLEIRMPITDTRIFDIASRMPSEYKVNAEQNKVAFRTAAAKVLPEEVAFRKKLGFIVPIRHWMADSRYNGDVYARIHGNTAEKFFNMDVVGEIWNEYIGGNSDLWRKIWVIYTFIVWYEIFFDTAPSANN